MVARKSGKPAKSSEINTGHAMDITARKKAEEALRESEANYHNLVENASIGIFRTKIDGSRVLEANPKLCEILGVTREEFIGQPSAIAWAHPEQREDLVRLLREKGNVSNYEIDIRTKSGEIRTVLMSMTTYPELGYIEGGLQDITERKGAEKALRLKNIVFDVSIAANSIADMSGNITEANDAFLRVWWYPTKKEVIGKPLLHFINDQSEAIAIVTALNSTGQWEGDYIAKRKDGSTFIAHGLATTIKDENGTVIGYQSAVMDFTQQREAEKDLKRYRDHLEQLVEERTANLLQSKSLLDETGRLARVGGWEIDLVKNELTWTDTVYLIHEMNKDYKPTVESGINFYAPEAIPVISECVKQAIENSKPFDVELQLITAKKNRIWVRAIGQAYKEGGKVVKVGGVFHDINERKMAEDKIKVLNLTLQQRASELEAANRELESFSYSVSHDLRTPLRAIDGFSKIIAKDYEEKLDDEGKRLLGEVRIYTHKMGKLIDDLLAFSRIGRQELTTTRIDMKNIVAKAMLDLDKEASGRNIQLIVGDMPTALGDRLLLSQVMINLLSNATKFTKNKEVAQIEVSGCQEGNEIIYSVKDNGAGFDMKYVDKLFGVFQRLHSADDFEGTGVGLAIVQRIIHKHGGRVWAEGKVNEGAAFFFALPNSNNKNELEGIN